MIFRKRALSFALAALATATLATGFLVAPSRAQDDEGSADVKERPQFVNERCEHAIEKGCVWLARNQKRSGELSEASGWGGTYSVAMTSLAGMAWLAHGDTMTQGKYSRNVRAAVEYILQCARRGA